MFNTIHIFHDHFRWLILFLALVEILFLLAMYSRKPFPQKGFVILSRIFLVMLDLQLVLGLVQLIYRISEHLDFRHAHPLIMLVAVFLAHYLFNKAKNAPEDVIHRKALWSVLIPLLWILLGIYL